MKHIEVVVVRLVVILGFLWLLVNSPRTIVWSKTYIVVPRCVRLGVGFVGYDSFQRVEHRA